MVLGTRVLGMAHIVSPMRVKYSAEASGPHNIPGNADVRGATQQLLCNAKGEAHATPEVHLHWRANCQFVNCTCTCRHAIRLCSLKHRGLCPVCGGAVLGAVEPGG